MILRKWQSEIINKYDEIRETHKKFILKAPTGAGKTVLASEIIKKFYAGCKSDLRIETTLCSTCCSNF